MKRIFRFIQLAQKALLRYPFVVAISLILTTYCIFEVMDWNAFYSSEFIVNLFISFAIAVPILIVTTIISEQNKWRKSLFWLSKVLGVLIIPVTLLILSNYDIDNNYKLIASIGAIILTAIFLLFLMPYRKRDEEYGFWNFNLSILIRLALTFAFASIIFGGIAAAFAIIDQLFAFDINDKAYGITSIIIYCLGVPWSFVAVIPQDYSSQNTPQNLSIIGKILGKYIFLTLLSIYFIIFYVYGAKIAITGAWPEGVVAYMIMGISLLGVLTLLILHPITKEGKSKFMKNLPLSYHIVIIPLLALYFMGISLRIGEYGFTLNRYFLVAFGIWQSLVALYYIIGKRDIRFTFVSFLIFILITFFSPWNAFKVCERSQVNRYLEILESEALLTKGKLKIESVWTNDDNDDYHIKDKTAINAITLSNDNKEELRSIVNYICEYHNAEQLTSVFPNTIPLTDSYFTNKTRILESLDINLYQDYSNSYFSYNFNYEHNIVQVSGYDYVIDIDHLNRPSQKTNHHINDFDITLSFGDTTINIEIDDRLQTIDLNKVLEYAKSMDDYQSHKSMTFNRKIDLRMSTQNKYYKIIFEPNYIHWESDKSTKNLIISNIDGRLLIKRI